METEEGVVITPKEVVAGEKLPIDFKEKWVAALRSGNYIQGKYMLYSPNHMSYCCLGVACVVMGYESKELINSCAPNVTISPLVPDLLTADTEVRQFLMEMNDLQNKNFNEIADWIELNL